MIYYETLLIIGALGMLAQAALGLGHGFGGHAHNPGAGHAGHGHAGHTGTHSHGQHSGHEQGEHTTSGPSPLWALLSPLAIFSLCLGAGATGLLVHSLLRGSWAALAALVGAFVFYGLLVRPLWNFVMRFASDPALALEGVVATNAEATGRFDAQGRGMVNVILDGQVVRLLAHLEPEDQQKGLIVVPGDKLTVTSVDGKTNTCHVTRL
jgi:hypothetical protein